jgi:hypothetical protein
MTAPLSLFPENMAVQAMSGDVKKAIEAAYESGWNDATRSLIKNASLMSENKEKDELFYLIILSQEFLDVLGIERTESEESKNVED